MKCPKCKAEISELDEVCPKCKTNFEEYEEQQNIQQTKINKRIYQTWWFWIGIIVAFIIIIFFINYNGLSKYETMEKFINLVSQSEYEKAKKYITSDFPVDLATIKKENLEYKKSFTSNYKNYKLDNENEIAYIRMDEYNYISVYIFRLKKTITGYKIYDCEIDISNY